MLKEFTVFDKDDMYLFDETIKFIPLTYDVMFKSIFKKNINLLKIFLLSQLDLKVEPDKCNICLLDSELPKSKYNEYQKKVDIFVRINEYYIDIEMNREYFEYIYKRNLIYSDKIYSTFLEKGQPITEIGKNVFIQLNLNASDKYDTYGKPIDIGWDVLSFQSIRNHKEYNYGKKIVIKYLEYYRNLYYNEDVKLNESELWLVLLSSRNFKELYDIGNKLMDCETLNSFIGDVINMCKKTMFIEDWEKKMIDDLGEYHKEQIIHQKGLEQGIEQGLEQGANQKEEEIVASMLKEKIDIDTIMKVTNSKKEDILKIQSNMN